MPSRKDTVQDSEIEKQVRILLAVPLITPGEMGRGCRKLSSCTPIHLTPLAQLLFKCAVARKFFQEFLYQIISILRRTVNVGNTDYGRAGRIDNFAPGDNKCNKFVNDAYEDGAGVDFPNRTSRFGTPRNQPPQANDLADPSNSYDNFPVVPEPAMPGDVLAFPSPAGEQGHSALYAGDGKITQGGLRAGSISDLNTMKGHHDGDVTIRRYTD